MTTCTFRAFAPRHRACSIFPPLLDALLINARTVPALCESNSLHPAQEFKDVLSLALHHSLTTSENGHASSMNLARAWTILKINFHFGVGRRPVPLYLLYKTLPINCLCRSTRMASHCNGWNDRSMFWVRLPTIAIGRNNTMHMKSNLDKSLRARLTWLLSFLASVWF